MPIVPYESFPFCGPSYLGASPVIDAQRSINLYCEPGYKSSNSQMALIGRPGLSAIFMTLANTPVRQLWAGNNRLFAVGGTHFFEVSNVGTVITDFGAMAGSTGVGPVMVSQNSGSSAFQLLVMDSSSSQIYNAAGGVMTSVFNGVALEMLDGYSIAVATGASLVAAGNPNQINVSNFGDGTTWNALNYVIRTGSADLVMQLAVLNGLLWIFGSKSIEIWYNAGNANFPFARVNGGNIALGLMAQYSVVKFYNTIMWLGCDDRGYPQVYMSQGMNPVRVSNFAIEYQLQTIGANLRLITAYGYQEAGHTFYVLNVMSSSFVPSMQYVYDLTTGLWHERLYTNAFPVCLASVPGNFAAAFNANGLNFVGDGKSGKMYLQDIQKFNDGAAGQTIQYVRYAPHVNNQNQVLRHNRLEIAGDFGTANPTLTYSNDGGRSFSGSPSYSMLQASDQGFTGQTFRRAWVRQLGRSRDRVYRVEIVDDANLIRIANAWLEVS